MGRKIPIFGACGQATTLLSLIDSYVDVGPEGIKSTKHKAKLGACVSALNLNHPFAADADLSAKVD